MMDDTKKDVLRKARERRYLNKDFEGFKRDLLSYARTYFPEANRDFSENSFGGMVLDLVASVGDVQSFYLDHQYQETFTDASVENRNIQRLLERDGVPIVGAAPAVVPLTCVIEVPAIGIVPRPDPAALPVLQAGAVTRASNGTEFETVESLDFSEVGATGELLASVSVGQRDSQSNPISFFVSRDVIAISGKRSTDSFSMESFQPFKSFTLSKENVTEIISVGDNFGNVYHEVDSLHQDTVWKAVRNFSSDVVEVPENLIPIPAPYRFTAKVDLQTRSTRLTFGGGSSESLNDDIIPDPSEFSLPLFGKKTLSRFTLNPGNLLKTTSLGVVAPNSTISVVYRHGGGLSHNVPRGSIRGFSSFNLVFPRSPNPSVTQFVRQSLDCVNNQRASGGEPAPTIDDLKQRAPGARSSQGRIVSKADLLARIYTMPSNFGRVFRAAVANNPNNPLSALLYVVSRDSNGRLIPSPDSLKDNLRRFLSTYRMIDDAIDILDSSVINIGVDFAIVVDPQQNKQIVIQEVIKRLSEYFRQNNFDINQPIVLSDLHNLVYNNKGVLSVSEIRVKNLFANIGERSYSDIRFNVEANTTRGIILGPPGSIFEVRYKDFDIIGTAV